MSRLNEAYNFSSILDILLIFLGIHLEGPFISKEKRGAHPAKYILDLNDGFDTLLKTYGTLDNVAIVTLAPETENCLPAIKALTDRGIKVSLGILAIT